LSPLALIELQMLITRVEKTITRVPAEKAFSLPKAKHWDQQTVGEWARKHIWNKKVHTVLNAAVQVIFGADMDELSMLHFLMYANAGGGLMKLCEIENAAQQDRVINVQSIAEGLAKTLCESVQLSSPVRRIVQDDELVSLFTDNKSWQASRVIVAVPPALAGRIEMDPPVPQSRDLLCQKMPMGATIKCHAIYEQNFWRDAGWSGEVVCDGNPLTVVFDNTTKEGTPALLGFIVGQPARLWGQKSVDERKDAVLGSFARWFGPSALQPIDYFEKDWAEDPWTRGCPIGITGPGTLSVHGEALRKPVGRIHWAGTETATQHMGFMDGALQAGERAAQEVLKA